MYNCGLQMIDEKSGLWLKQTIKQELEIMWPEITRSSTSKFYLLKFNFK